MLPKWWWATGLVGAEVAASITLGAVSGKPTPEIATSMPAHCHVFHAILHAPMTVKIATVAKTGYLCERRVIAYYEQKAHFALEHTLT
jgi:hypothetical protein